MKQNYELPKLNYSYDALKPFISEEQLRLHHEMHHRAYVDNANSLSEKMAKARHEGSDIDQKSMLKAMSFNLGGHILHSIFWSILGPAGRIKNAPESALAKAISDEFASMERFRKEFTDAAMSVEGSGWAALVWCTHTERLMLMQIEKHDVHIYPSFHILMLLDVWEHAYYLDYKNARAKFVEAFWSILDWGEVDKRFNQVRA